MQADCDKRKVISWLLAGIWFIIPRESWHASMMGCKPGNLEEELGWEVKRGPITELLLVFWVMLCLSKKSFSFRDLRLS